MKIIAAGGAPASGKSTIMRRVVKELGPGKIKKHGLLVYQLHPQTKCIVLGSYEKKGFGGTDRLSMAVQPEALCTVIAWSLNPAMSDWTILFEGDRLFNSSFLKDLEKIGDIDYYWIIVEASDETQNKRHKERKDTQSEKWLKGRKTKVEKLKSNLEKVILLRNDSKEDLQNNVNQILEMVGLK